MLVWQLVRDALRRSRVLAQGFGQDPVEVHEDFVELLVKSCKRSLRDLAHILDSVGILVKCCQGHCVVMRGPREKIL